MQKEMHPGIEKCSALFKEEMCPSFIKYYMYKYVSKLSCIKVFRYKYLKGKIESKNLEIYKYVILNCQSYIVLICYLFNKYMFSEGKV